AREIACASRLSMAQAARWIWWRSRAHFGVAHDGGNGADARARVRRGGGLPQGHRRAGTRVSGGAVVGPVLGDGVRVSEPTRHRRQDPGLRRAGLLAVPEAALGGPVPVLAGGGGLGAAGAVGAPTPGA